MKMSPRERILTALRRDEPDRVPSCEFGVNRGLAETLMGWKHSEMVDTTLEMNPFTVEEAKALAAFLGHDEIPCVLRAPVYTKKTIKNGQLFYGEGLIQSEADLEKVDLPDPHRDELYATAESFAKNKGDYAAILVTRAGFFPAFMGMGMQTFSYSLHENQSFLERLMDMYFDWAEVVVERICQLDFDILVTTDDMAFKTGPFASPQVFRELVFPRFKRVVEKATIPWVHHSDGNIEPLIPDFIELGVAGMHPFEKGAADIRAAKRTYGDKICIFGNLDLNILGDGSPEDVDAEVRNLIRDLAPGGGYVITSGNSLAGYLKPDNVRAFAAAVRKYGSYPITL